MVQSVTHPQTEIELPVISFNLTFKIVYKYSYVMSCQENNGTKKDGAVYEIADIPTNYKKVS